MGRKLFHSSWCRIAVPKLSRRGVRRAQPAPRMLPSVISATGFSARERMTGYRWPFLRMGAMAFLKASCMVFLSYAGSGQYSDRARSGNKRIQPRKNGHHLSGTGGRARFREAFALISISSSAFPPGWVNDRSAGFRFRAALAQEKPLQVAGCINAYSALSGGASRLQGAISFRRRRGGRVAGSIRIWVFPRLTMC